MASRLRVTMDPERPDHADLLAAVEIAPAGGGRRAWLRDLVMAGFRRVGTYEQWRTRIAGRARAGGQPVTAPAPPCSAREEPGSVIPGGAASSSRGPQQQPSTPPRDRASPPSALRSDENGSLERSPAGDGDESCAILKLL